MDDRLGTLTRLEEHYRRAAAAGGEPAVVADQTAAALDWCMGEIERLRKLVTMYRETIGRTPGFVFRLVDAWADGGKLDFNGEVVPPDVAAYVQTALARVEASEVDGEEAG